MCSIKFNCTIEYQGPARIHEVSIEKPTDVRGFGFKSDGGQASNRPIYISYIEDGTNLV